MRPSMEELKKVPQVHAAATVLGLARTGPAPAVHSALVASAAAPGATAWEEQMQRERAALAQRETELAHREAALAQRLRAAEEAEAQLGRAQEELERRAAALAEREQRSQAAEAALQGRAQELAQRTATLAQREQHAQAALARRETAVAQREHAAKEREAQLACAQTELGQRAAALAKREHTAKEKEAQLGRRQAELAQHAQALAEREAALAAQRDKVYAALSPLAHAASPQGTVAAMGATPSPVRSACTPWTPVTPWSAVGGSRCAGDIALHTPHSRRLFGQDGAGEPGRSPARFDIDVEMETPVRARGSALGSNVSAGDIAVHSPYSRRLFRQQGSPVHTTNMWTTRFVSEDEACDTSPSFDSRFRDLG